MTPLTPAVFHILLALAGGKRHGYAISKEVLRQTDGRMRMGPGTLYGTLQRLLDQGWVEAVDGPESADERRRYYQLTPLGLAVARAEAERLAGQLSTARARRLLRGGPA